MVWALTTIRDVVPVHARQHHVVDAPVRHRLGRVLWLQRIKRGRSPRGLHRTKPAAPVGQEEGGDQAVLQHGGFAGLGSAASLKLPTL